MQAWVGAGPHLISTTGAGGRWMGLIVFCKLLLVLACCDPFPPSLAKIEGPRVHTQPVKNKINVST